jgi:hypothetical protein
MLRGNRLESVWVSECGGEWGAKLAPGPADADTGEKLAHDLHLYQDWHFALKARLDHALAIVEAAEKWGYAEDGSPTIQAAGALARAIQDHAAAAKGKPGQEEKPDIRRPCALCGRLMQLGPRGTAKGWKGMQPICDACVERDTAKRMAPKCADCGKPAILTTCSSPGHDCQAAWDYMALDAAFDHLGKESLRDANEAHTGIALMINLQAADEYFSYHLRRPKKPKPHAQH